MTIKELREAKGLSQAAFAKAIGVSTGAMSNYDSGRRQPSEEAIAKIKEVFGVDLNDAAAKVEKKVAAAAKEVEKKAAPAAKEVKKAAAKAEKKVAAVAKEAEKKAAPVKAAEKKQAEPAIIIQSPMGGSITPAEIIAKVGKVDSVYVRVDENKAYWVRGEETGSVDLW